MESLTLELIGDLDRCRGRFLMDRYRCPYELEGFSFPEAFLLGSQIDIPPSHLIYSLINYENQRAPIL